MEAVFKTIQMLVLKSIARILISSIIISFSISVNLYANQKGPDQISSAETFATLVPQLLEKSYKKKQLVIEKLSNIEDKRLLPLFNEMLAGQLRFIKQNKKVVYIKANDNGFEATDVINAESYGVFDKRKLKKVKVNNKLRGMLRGFIARINLKSENPSIREASVISLIKTLDASNISLLRDMLEVERNQSVISLINMALCYRNIKRVIISRGKTSPDIGSS